MFGHVFLQEVFEGVGFCGGELKVEEGAHDGWNVSHLLVCEGLDGCVYSLLLVFYHAFFNGLP